ncbi:MAG TPA: ribonuclease HII [Candidatus Methanoculleus thermohydrogenotrophicum]|nr:ribonuclease HII [Candidatus Methanoculleus thermohydrogenotrophicum]NLM81631.1 ribonuclease HII [Candidatus Methanoculleus thermohydrogenotrophicum]HOB18424.1 ribonuclease HII [Candidatus Methanoculleus thermohydrogenotrophicum]HPZ38353.1 ribonuclease HII [Candidatus Methanoculleus thermohydrogenotrophicum]HQC91721.1 ribonuclease HII [Candidatus Methanoculleus thermohydrogenotrophicum]
MICGVDEAGKGSVLGPMVIAAVGCRDAGDLAPLPIRDSKALRPKQREAIYEILLRDFAISIVTIDAAGIDEARSRMSMNECVAELHAEALMGLRPRLAYVDACDVNAERYGKTVSNHLDFPCEIIAEHRADARHKIVGAASVVAKVTRDRAIRDLSERYGMIGSGYPSDPVTIEFLRRYIRNYGSPPPCARRSWKTVANLCQTRIADFL